MVNPVKTNKITYTLRENIVQKYIIMVLIENETLIILRRYRVFIAAKKINFVPDNN